MGLFNRKKKAEETVSEQERLDEELRDDISKAYDELVSGGGEEPEKQEKKPEAEMSGEEFENEVFKAKLRNFKEKKTQEALIDIVELLAGRKFFLPSVSNMKQPFENINGELKLKKGAVLNPALLTSNDKKTFLPIFTDEKSMVQKSPSGITLKYKFEQCVGIVYNKNNSVTGIVINPFTENFIIGEELLKAVFKKVEKENG